MANISRDIQAVVSAPESKDELKWMHNSDGSPTIRDFYDHMRSKGSMNIWSEAIWRHSIQPRRSLTLWKAIHSLLPTEKSLQRKGFYLASCCRFCQDVEEDIDNIFLHCQFANSILARLEATFGTRINRNEDLKVFINSATKFKMSKQVYNLWISGIVSTVWIIWKICNEVVFEENPFSMHQALTLLWACIHEADQLDSGTMSNSISDLAIFKSFKNKNWVNKLPKIIEVQ